MHGLVRLDIWWLAYALSSLVCDGLEAQAIKALNDYPHKSQDDCYPILPKFRNNGLNLKNNDVSCFLHSNNKFTKRKERGIQYDEEYEMKKGFPSLSDAELHLFSWWKGPPAHNKSSNHTFTSKKSKATKNSFLDNSSFLSQELSNISITPTFTPNLYFNSNTNVSDTIGKNSDIPVVADSKYSNYGQIQLENDMPELGNADLHLYSWWKAFLLGNKSKDATTPQIKKKPNPHFSQLHISTSLPISTTSFNKNNISNSSKISISSLPPNTPLLYNSSKTETSTSSFLTKCYTITESFFPSVPLVQTPAEETTATSTDTERATDPVSLADISRDSSLPVPVNVIEFNELTTTQASTRIRDSLSSPLKPVYEKLPSIQLNTSYPETCRGDLINHSIYNKYQRDLNKLQIPTESIAVNEDSIEINNHNGYAFQNKGYKMCKSHIDLTKVGSQSESSSQQMLILNGLSTMNPQINNYPTVYSKEIASKKALPTIGLDHVININNLRGTLLVNSNQHPTFKISDTIERTEINKIHKSLNSHDKNTLDADQANGILPVELPLNFTGSSNSSLISPLAKEPLNNQNPILTETNNEYIDIFKGYKNNILSENKKCNISHLFAINSQSIPSKNIINEKWPVQGNPNPSLESKEGNMMFPYHDSIDKNRKSERIEDIDISKKGQISKVNKENSLKYDNLLPKLQFGMVDQQDNNLDLFVEKNNITRQKNINYLLETVDNSNQSNKFINPSSFNNHEQVSQKQLRSLYADSQNTSLLNFDNNTNMDMNSLKVYFKYNETFLAEHSSNKQNLVEICKNITCKGNDYLAQCCGAKMLSPEMCKGEDFSYQKPIPGDITTTTGKTCSTCSGKVTAAYKCMNKMELLGNKQHYFDSLTGNIRVPRDNTLSDLVRFQLMHGISAPDSKELLNALKEAKRQVQKINREYHPQSDSNFQQVPIVERKNLQRKKLESIPSSLNTNRILQNLRATISDNFLHKLNTAENEKCQTAHNKEVNDQLNTFKKNSLLLDKLQEETIAKLNELSQIELQRRQEEELFKKERELYNKELIALKETINKEFDKKKLIDSKYRMVENYPASDLLQNEDESTYSKLVKLIGNSGNNEDSMFDRYSNMQNNTNFHNSKVLEREKCFTENKNTHLDLEGNEFGDISFPVNKVESEEKINDPSLRKRRSNADRLIKVGNNSPQMNDQNVLVVSSNDEKPMENFKKTFDSLHDELFDLEKFIAFQSSKHHTTTEGKYQASSKEKNHS